MKSRLLKWFVQSILLGVILNSNDLINAEKIITVNYATYVDSCEKKNFRTLTSAIRMKRAN